MSNLFWTERTFIVVLAVVLLAGLGVGIVVPRFSAQAQTLEAQTYNVIAGGGAEYNTAILAFAPQSLQVRRGDTVTWLMAGFHNVHFSSGASELVVEGEVDGQPIMQVNPAVAFPTIENGAVYTGGDANSGLPFDPESASATFSLVMDVEPGSYSYFCDIHPGMVGVINVVEEGTDVPSPAEVMETAANEMAMNANMATGAAMEAAMQPPSTTEDGALEVQAGLQVGQSAILSFFPQVTVIDAGQSVTWTIPAASSEPHTVTNPPLPPGSEFDVIPQEGGPPIMAINENGIPPAEGVLEVGADGNFNTGILFPGQSFTLTFPEPGVYEYVCFIHPGMNGTVVVQTPE